ncbi:DNA replication complex GINS protein PSF3 isoform X2 [Pituophis catenifer annectens]|uniref:DNA replication complex GINS protein PSF3 isoform X2 n=1 Tax=Pituophis catenifer annectens TaxID=94852 RepID=UPI0039927B3E
MAHPYAPVEAALGPDESFLSLADILMSQERLPCRAEVAWPRLAAFLARADAAAAPDKALPETFIGRFRHIMDSSQNTFNEDTSALVARLDELERALFQTGQKRLQDFQCWEMGQASQITVSSLIQNYKKRKFTDVDS